MEQTLPNYADVTFWDDNYKKTDGKTFEWLLTWSDLKPIVEEHVFKHLFVNFENMFNLKLKKSLKILHLGCGNSTLTEELYDDGFTHIYNIDISEVCIE